MKAINVEIEKDEDFYIAQCVEHSNCFTQGKTIEDDIHNIKEVLELVLEIKYPKLNIILEKELVYTSKISRGIVWLYEVFLPTIRYGSL